MFLKHAVFSRIREPRFVRFEFERGTVHEPVIK